MLNKCMKYLLFFLLLHITTVSLVANPIRIMPLGDSITRGYPSTTGYRSFLWHQLNDANYNIDFVGSQIHGYNATPSFDFDHEGYNYFKTYDLAEIVYGLLEDNEPDVILLHIGSNDVSPTQGLNSSSVTGLEDILNKIDNYELNYNHSIIVILASIINRKEYHKTVTDFNINLRKMALKRINNGDKIILVNMESDAGLTAADYADRTHPNNNGYLKMSYQWFNALNKIIPTIADNYSWLIPIYTMML